MDFLTITEIAEKWNISRRRVITLCREGRIKGAILKGKNSILYMTISNRIINYHNLSEC